jgi:hypothetical protein
VRASGSRKKAQDLGHQVHARIATIVDDENNPDFVAEMSYDPMTGDDQRPSAKESFRIDLLDHKRPTAVCVYDQNAGESVLRTTRAVDIMSVFQNNLV